MLFSTAKNNESSLSHVFFIWKTFPGKSLNIPSVQLFGCLSACGRGSNDYSMDMCACVWRSECCVINLGVITTFGASWGLLSPLIRLFIPTSFLLHHSDLCTVTATTAGQDCWATKCMCTSVRAEHWLKDPEYVGMYKCCIYSFTLLSKGNSLLIHGFVLFFDRITIDWGNQYACITGVSKVLAELLYWLINIAYLPWCHLSLIVCQYLWT